MSFYRRSGKEYVPFGNIEHAGILFIGHDEGNPGNANRFEMVNNSLRIRAFTGCENDKVVHGELMQNLKCKMKNGLDAAVRPPSTGMLVPFT